MPRNACSRLRRRRRRLASMASIIAQQLWVGGLRNQGAVAFVTTTGATAGHFRHDRREEAPRVQRARNREGSINQSESAHLECITCAIVSNCSHVGHHVSKTALPNRSEGSLPGLPNFRVFNTRFCSWGPRLDTDHYFRG